MLTTIWNTILIFPITNLFLFFHKILGSFGLAIVGVTIVSRLFLWPVMVSSIKTANIQKELLPELNALKEKYKDDKKKLAEAQGQLYKDKGINPASGCLTQILQLVFIIALYSVLRLVLDAKTPEAVAKINSALYSTWLYVSGAINTKFLYFDLTKPDPYYILPVLSGLAQFAYSKLMNAPLKKEAELAEKTVAKTDDISYNMQQQMLYTMPVMTVIIGLKLPAGLTFYWFLSTLLSLFQHLLIVRGSKKAS